MNALKTLPKSARVVASRIKFKQMADDATQDHQQDPPIERKSSMADLTVDLPLPGQLVAHDLRSGTDKETGDRCLDQAHLQLSHNRMKIATWNLEYGRDVDRIVAELRAIDADILFLQGVDIGFDRTGLVCSINMFL